MELINGKVAIVTGGAEGIGRSIALALAGAGAKVVIADVQNCEDTIDAIGELGGIATSVKCDVSCSNDVADLMRMTEETFGGLDILVNNAGIMGFSPVEEGDLGLLDRIYETNVKGTYQCCSKGIAYLRKSSSPVIINISSTMFFMGIPGAAAYAASKGAIIGFSRTLARELKPDRIRVNVVTPGFITTPGVEKLELSGDFSVPLLSQQCVERLGSPEDIAKAVLFLASNDSAFMSGQTLNVDGGLVTV